MTLPGVVPAFDSGKYCQVGFGTGFEGLAVNEFALEAGEEALRHGIQAHRPPFSWWAAHRLWRQRLPKATLVY